MYKHIKYSCTKNKTEDLTELVRLLNLQLESKDKQLEKQDKQIETQSKQIEKLMGKLEINGSFNTTINNVNINLLNYDDTDISHLTEKDYMFCIKKVNFCVKNLIEKIHFNPDKPENMNIYISNLKDKYLMMYEDGNWNIKHKSELDTLYQEKEMLLEEVEYDLEDIESRFQEKARAEAQEIIYDEIHDKLENDLSSWLEEYGYTDNLQDVSFLSVDYEKIGEELSSDYLIIEYDGEMYFFNNYAKGGRIMATKQKPKNNFYIVENSTKKLVSGYSTKNEALEQRKLLIEEYPSMRFEIYTLDNLEAKTNLDVYAKKDYVELSTLDKIKKVSVDAFRYGKEKVGQANEFLVKNDVKGKIKRGAGAMGGIRISCQ
jgi:hypothetical protein